VQQGFQNHFVAQILKTVVSGYDDRVLRFGHPAGAALSAFIIRVLGKASHYGHQQWNDNGGIADSAPRRPGAIPMHRKQGTA
jgi:hypothetical protein